MSPRAPSGGGRRVHKDGAPSGAHTPTRMDRMTGSEQETDDGLREPHPREAMGRQGRGPGPSLHSTRTITGNRENDTEGESRGSHGWRQAAEGKGSPLDLGAGTGSRGGSPAEHTRAPGRAAGTSSRRCGVSAVTLRSRPAHTAQRLMEITRYLPRRPGEGRTERQGGRQAPAYKKQRQTYKVGNKKMTSETCEGKFQR